MIQDGDGRQRSWGRRKERNGRWAVADGDPHPRPLSQRERGAVIRSAKGTG